MSMLLKCCLDDHFLWRAFVYVKLLETLTFRADAKFVRFPAVVVVFFSWIIEHVLYFLNSFKNSYDSFLLIDLFVCIFSVKLATDQSTQQKC